VTIHFPEFAITLDRREKGPEEEYVEFTRLHSRAINETPLVGSIGSVILSRYRVTFDLRNGIMELAEPAAAEDKADAEPVPEPQDGGAIEVSTTTAGDLMWLPVQLGDGTVRAMTVSTTRYDSLLDRDWCKRLGFPAGDVGPLKLGGLDLGSFVAFRPADMPYRHPDGALGLLGLNLLKHLRLTVDPKSKTARCRVTAEPELSQEDRDYFKVMVTADLDQLEAWLEKYPNGRLSPEAAQRLLDERLSGKAEPAKIESALRRLRLTWPEDMVSTKALRLMRNMLAAGRPVQAVFVGEMGIRGGRKDRDPNSVHQIHASLGQILLAQGEDKRAWRHLLSAAFGIPDDGPVNLNLGRFYEKQERYNRAISRYVQAVIRPETGEQALEGLERVQRKMGNAQPLSVDTIAPLIAGKTYGFATATRYRPEAGKETNRVSLVEFFTNAHFKQPGKEEGAIGGALANEGVMTYFPRGKVAMLTYHLAHPKLDLDSLAATYYGVGPAVQLVDGDGRFPGEGHRSDAEEIFQKGRDTILSSLQEPSDYKLELSGTVEGDTIAGTLKVTDQSAGFSYRPPTVQIVLAERGALYPGKSNVIIQRMVARAALTDSTKGIPFEPKDGSMTIPFSRSLAEITRENADFLKKLEAAGAGTAQAFATRMDPRQLTVVAFVRDADSKKILQAIQIDPDLPVGKAAKP
jgi:tetratricopeptide (TPR) repeat protein